MILRLLLLHVCMLTAIATEYFIDYSGGSDAGAGTSTGAAWKHCPGDSAATGNAASITPAAGDVFWFKGGVTYYGATTCPVAGSLIQSSAAQSVSSAGAVANSSGFASALNGDWMTIYNSSTNGSYLETCGVWPLTNITATSASLIGFDGLAATGSIAYIVTRPITYAGNQSWGAGAAAVSGSLTNTFAFRLKPYLRFASLTLIDTLDVPANGCQSSDEQGLLWDNSATPGVMLDSLTLSNSFAGINAAGAGDYMVVKNCLFSNFQVYGSVVGQYSIISDNTYTNGLSAVRGCGKYSVIRRNHIVDCNRASTNACGFHADGIGPLFSPAADPGANQYGWIYGNVVDNTVEGIFLEYNNGGTAHWTICNNVLIGHAASGSGDAAILIASAPFTRVFNNTITGVAGDWGWGAAFRLGQNDTQTGAINSTNCQFVANIVYCTNTASSNGIRVYTTATNGFQADYNDYYQLLTTGNSFAVGAGSPGTLTAWQAFGFDEHALVANPLLLDPGETNTSLMNLLPARTSPCLRASPSVVLASITDPAGRAFGATTPGDIGAYFIDVAVNARATSIRAGTLRGK